MEKTNRRTSGFEWLERLDRKIMNYSTLSTDLEEFLIAIPISGLNFKHDFNDEYGNGFDLGYGDLLEESGNGSGGGDVDGSYICQYNLNNNNSDHPDTWEMDFFEYNCELDIESGDGCEYYTDNADDIVNYTSKL
jgi:hypothetical protein